MTGQDQGLFRRNLIESLWRSWPKSLNRIQSRILFLQGMQSDWGRKMENPLQYDVPPIIVIAKPFKTTQPNRCSYVSALKCDDQVFWAHLLPENFETYLVC